jgi:hypothetical protein
MFLIGAAIFAALYIKLQVLTFIINASQKLRSQCEATVLRLELAINISFFYVFCEAMCVC